MIWIWRAVLLVLCAMCLALALSSCATTTEQVWIEVQPTLKDGIPRCKIDGDITGGAVNQCRKLITMHYSPYTTVICTSKGAVLSAACAVVQPYVCDVYLPVGLNTAYSVLGSWYSATQILGHEVRHCFDGTFH